MAVQAASRAARRELQALWVQVESLEQSISGLLGRAWQQVLELAAAVDAEAVATCLAGAIVLWVAWRLLRPQTAREVLEEYEDEMQVHVVWLGKHALLDTPEAKVTGLTRSKVLSAAPRLELPNPDGMARAAMERVSQVREQLATFTGSDAERGLMVWQEFLLPVVIDARIINDVLDDIHGATDVMLSRRYELRCLLCLLWSVVMPCTPSLPFGSSAWLQAKVGQPREALHLRSAGYNDVTDDDDIAERKQREFEQSKLMFFEQIARLLRLVVPLGNRVLGIREQDRSIMWRGFRDFILIARHTLGGARTLRRMPATGSENSGNGRQQALDEGSPTKRSAQELWRHYELWDERSPWYIQGLESVEETPDLINHLQGWKASQPPVDSDPDPTPEHTR